MNKILDSLSSYQIKTGDFFIIPPWPGALALHARIISLEKLGVFLRAQSEPIKNSNVQ